MGRFILALGFLLIGVLLIVSFPDHPIAERLMALIGG